MLRERHPQATVLITPDDILDGRGDATSRAWAQRTVQLLGRQSDVVFSSEAYGRRYAAFLGARRVSVDPARSRFPVSGNAVRADPWGNAEFLLPPPARACTSGTCACWAPSQPAPPHSPATWPPTTAANGCRSTDARSARSDWRRRRRLTGAPTTSRTSLAPAGRRGRRRPAAHLRHRRPRHVDLARTLLRHHL